MPCCAVDSPRQLRDSGLFTTHPTSDNHDGPHALRPQSDRLSAHRRRAHGAVQLAVRPRARRAVPAADRRHRRSSGTSTRRSRRSCTASLAGPRLGRRPRGRRAARAVLPVAAAGDSYQAAVDAAAGQRATPIATSPRPRRFRPSAKPPRAEKRPFTLQPPLDGRDRRRRGSASRPKAGRPSCG